MYTCGTCSTDCLTDVLQCNGVCEPYFHATIKCSSIRNDIAKIILKHPNNVKYLCHDCNSVKSVHILKVIEICNKNVCEVDQKSEAALQSLNKFSRRVTTLETTLDETTVDTDLVKLDNQAPLIDKISDVCNKLQMRLVEFEHQDKLSDIIKRIEAIDKDLKNKSDEFMGNIQCKLESINATLSSHSDDMARIKDTVTLLNDKLDGKVDYTSQEAEVEVDAILQYDTRDDDYFKNIPTNDSIHEPLELTPPPPIQFYYDDSLVLDPAFSLASTPCNNTNASLDSNQDWLLYMLERHNSETELIQQRTRKVTFNDNVSTMHFSNDEEANSVLENVWIYVATKSQHMTSLNLNDMIKENFGFYVRKIDPLSKAGTTYKSFKILVTPDKLNSLLNLQKWPKHFYIRKFETEKKRNFLECQWKTHYKKRTVIRNPRRQI